jgi:hypothetical protein
MEKDGELHALEAVSPGKDSLNKRLGGRQSRSGYSGEEGQFLILPRFKPRTVQIVALSLCRP